MIDAVAYPFMQRALAAGLLIGLVASLLGVFVILRRSAFFGDAVAHASLAGIAVGVVSGVPPLLFAAAVAVEALSDAGRAKLAAVGVAGEHPLPGMIQQLHGVARVVIEANDALIR